MANSRRTTAKAEAAAEAPQVLQEYSNLQGQRYRVVLMHAPGIDHFIVVETLNGDQWEMTRTPPREIFNPVRSALEVTIIQLAFKLAEAQKQLAQPTQD